VGAEQRLNDGINLGAFQQGIFVPANAVKPARTNIIIDNKLFQDLRLLAGNFRLMHPPGLGDPESAESLIPFHQPEHGELDGVVKHLLELDDFRDSHKTMLPGKGNRCNFPSRYFSFTGVGN